MKRALLFPFIAGLLGVNLTAQVPAKEPATQDRGTVQVLRAPSEIDKQLQTAAEIHEGILILLAEHDYEAVYPEFRKILALGLGGELESTLIDAAWVIVKDLSQNRQFTSAHQIIDATMSQVSGDKSRWRLLMLKAQTYRDAGDLGATRRMIYEARKLEP